MAIGTRSSALACMAEVEEEEERRSQFEFFLLGTFANTFSYLIKLQRDPSYKHVYTLIMREGAHLTKF